jgi:hypothetical protein
MDRIRDPGHTGDAILPGDDGAVDKHAPTPFHDSRGKRDDEGHGGVHGVANEDFPVLKMEEKKHVAQLSGFLKKAKKTDF